MTSRDFCYWMQGFFELMDAEQKQGAIGHSILTESQVLTVRRHLAMVFRHEIDPSFGSSEKVEDLRKVHEGLSSGRPPPLPPSSTGMPMTMPGVGVAFNC